MAQNTPGNLQPVEQQQRRVEGSADSGLDSMMSNNMTSTTAVSNGNPHRPPHAQKQRPANNTQTQMQRQTQPRAQMRTQTQAQNQTPTRPKSAGYRTHLPSSKGALSTSQSTGNGVEVIRPKSAGYSSTGRPQLSTTTPLMSQSSTLRHPVTPQRRTTAAAAAAAAQRHPNTPPVRLRDV